MERAAQFDRAERGKLQAYVFAVFGRGEPAILRLSDTSRNGNVHLRKGGYALRASCRSIPSVCCLVSVIIFASISASPSNILMVALSLVTLIRVLFLSISLLDR